MVSGARTDGGTQTLPARVRNTIQSIKEVVGNHSDADIYVTLKETNMDPNETAQKLLNQDPFHEVKRKRDKKKESTGYKGSADPRKHTENVGQGMKFHMFSDRNVRRGGYTRNSLPDAGMSREFRVVRDNRVNQNTNREVKPASQQCSTSANEQVISNVAEKGSSTGTSNSPKASGGRHSSQASNGPTDSHLRHSRDSKSSGSDTKELLEERRATVPSTVSRGRTGRPNDSQTHSATLASNNYVVGVYSSSSDPVHVPSLDSRSYAAVGAIRREVGVVGVRRQSSENSVKHSSVPGSSFSNSLLGRDNPSTESFRHFTAISKSDQLSQTTVPESVMPNMSVSRPFLGNQYGGRPHQQPVGHQKAPQPNKEWKPKLSQKSSLISPGVIGTPAKSVSPPADDSKGFETEAAKLQDKLSQVNIYENQNVIIAEHIRVPETDRCRLTFGSFGPEFDSARNFVPRYQAVGAAEDSGGEHSASLSVSAPESSSDDISGSKHVDLLDDEGRDSGSESPVSGCSGGASIT
ncbi:hypothetical protein L1049_004547 [Liquidambar formosana]|uniref:GBF-interacting protein 1 N-terminal domain-containing protein n=1 Tax=Liquidambar formosana TaxID=63359 RepID=A0AAP0RT26_LIQFO